MANYFYVKSGGSLGRDDDTSFSAEQADSFANIGVANYYDSIAVALDDGTKTNPAIDGDFVLVSDAHTKSFDPGGPVSVNFGGSISGVGLQVLSVDDGDTSAYKPGADETWTDTGDDYNLNGPSLFSGVSLITGDNCLVAFIANIYTRFVDSVIGNTGTGDIAITANAKDGCSFNLINTDIDAGDSGALPFEIGNGGSVIWNGGALTGTAVADFIRAATFGANGGAFLEINGVDLSNVTGTIMPSTTAGTTDFVTVKLRNVKLNDSLTNLHGTLAMPYHRFEMYNTDDSSDKFYRFYIADGTGSAKNNDSVYVTAGEAWYGGSDHSSIQVDTNALCSYVYPLVFELPAQYIDLAVGTTDTLTIDIVTAETLVKHDLAAFLVYPDGTTAVQPNWVSSGPSATGYTGIDPLDTSTAMPTSALGAGDWTGEPGTPNFYELVLDTSSDVGQATAVSVRIEVYKASIGPIYIHPLITVSAT